MEKKFLDKVKDNEVVQIWSEKIQQEKGDSLKEGYVSELWDFTHINYMILLRSPNIQADKAYSRAANVPTFLKKLMSITGMNEQWVTTRIKQKGYSKCIP
ncbi:hypothetical protein Gogos_019958 [Gossypium gossypioides]|uniref:Uncharacterized protein n=1 Tax=Gossypium gossypioides TaxID=34282 RepID=A0A7J9D7G7_GOSGO|nr:hypothetical protein [Gossypium gossypioides]